MEIEWDNDEGEESSESDEENEEQDEQDEQGEQGEQGEDNIVRGTQKKVDEGKRWSRESRGRKASFK
jgi:hypothetical protein